MSGLPSLRWYPQSDKRMAATVFMEYHFLARIPLTFCLCRPIMFRVIEGDADVGSA